MQVHSILDDLSSSMPSTSPPMVMWAEMRNDLLQEIEPK